MFVNIRRLSKGLRSFQDGFAVARIFGQFEMKDEFEVASSVVRVSERLFFRVSNNTMLY